MNSFLGGGHIPFPWGSINSFERTKFTESDRVPVIDLTAHDSENEIVESTRGVPANADTFLSEENEHFIDEGLFTEIRHE
jgi:hypothetical protein